MLLMDNMETVIFYKTFIPRMWCIYRQECFLHWLIPLLFPWVRCIYMQEYSVHFLIRLLFPWVQCIYTCKNIFYTSWYHFYSHGCDVFTCKNVLRLGRTSSIPMGAMYLHARMFCTLSDMILYPLQAPIFAVITEVWPCANQAMVIIKVMLIDVVLIKGFLYNIFLNGDAFYYSL